MARRPQPRRGVLLLIVLSLLVLFLMVGLSFIVSAGQFKQLSDQDAKTELTGMPGEKLANAALYQILRGTRNPQSDVLGHSMLEDLYGTDYLKGTADAIADYESSGTHLTQVIQFQTSKVEFQSEGNTVPVSKLDDYFGGCVLTYISGNARGMSTRIVRFRYPTNSATGSIITVGVMDAQNNPPAAGSEFIINGRPFNGVGAGFNSVTGRLNRNVTLANSAELPIPAAYVPNYTLQTNYDFGGLDEAWDNVDFQTMYLAKPAEPNLAGGSSNLFVQNTAGAIPSFHRPFLYAYLASHQDYEEYWNNASLRHLFVLRPSRFDHPGFTGSNPDFDPINGPWDVDNDGDGVPDSIWLDFGLSPVSGPDGRMYKPLIAPMIVALDGRRNVNTADSLSRLLIDPLSTPYLQFNSAVQTPSRVMGATGGTGNNIFGAGFGPADVTLGTPRGSNFSNNGGARKLASRYQPTTGSVELIDSRPGLEVLDDDKQLWDGGRVGSERWTTDYVTENGLVTGYGSTSDFAGTGLPFIDSSGNLLWRQPIQIQNNVVRTNDGFNDPYEINPYQRTANDNLFDIEEMVSALRLDGNVSTETDRSIVGGAFGTGRELTALSSYIPALPSVNSGRFRFGSVGGDGLRRSIRDIIAARLLRDGGATNEQQAFQLAENFVPAELLRGEKLDLNRMLTPNLVSHTPQQELELLNRKRLFARDLYLMMMLVSDPIRQLPVHPLSKIPLNDYPEQRVRFHARRVAQWAINVVDFGDADSVMTRFIYDPTPFNDPNNEDPTVITTLLMSAPDLQALENTNAALVLDEVWGCEHPELLLTETLAFHDRRVDDTAKGKRRDENNGQNDEDLDQDGRPQGSLFVELYCARAAVSVNAARFQASGQLSPRNTVTNVEGTTGDVASRPPEDLYEIVNNQAVLDLGKWPANSLKPTWRLAISERHLQDPEELQANSTTAMGKGNGDSEISALEARNKMPDVVSFEPNDFDLRRIQHDPLIGESDDADGLHMSLERFIWFTNRPPPGNSPGPELARNTFYARADANALPPRARPGDYVVIGPRMNTPVGPQSINLSNPAGIRRSTPAGRVNTVVAQTSRSGAGCSISEPTDTARHYYDYFDDPARAQQHTPYDETEPTNNPDIPDTEQRPLWEPLPGADDEDDANYTLASGTRENIRTIFLQRLANPNRPWDPINNPYRTIDWMPIDLTVFNSVLLNEEDAPDGEPLDPRNPEGVEILGANELWEHQDPATKQWSETQFNFGSREKGGLGLNLWSADTIVLSTTRRSDNPALVVVRPEDKTNVPPPNTVDDLVDHPLYHTLGWLNRSWDLGQNMPGMPNQYAYDGEGHYRIAAQQFFEAPVPWRDPETNLPTTFSSLVWNNRPYANAFEAMLVPATSQGRLTHQYSTSLPISPMFAPSEAYAGYYGPFRHLLNFFQSSTGQPGDPIEAQNFYRIFDYVNVPSRFVGTEHWFGTAASQLTQNNPFFVDRNFSKFRAPGHVWLNGVANTSIFLHVGMDGLPQNVNPTEEMPLNRFMNARDFEQTLAGNRPFPSTSILNSGGFTNEIRFPTGEFPSMYPNPLRPAATADLVPEVIPGAELGVDATLLRSSSYRDTSLNPISQRQPALAKYREALTTGPLTLVQKDNPPFPSEFGQAFQNRKNNAFFRYRDIQKVGGSASSQANVYAVWITVGYFEIEPNFIQKPPTDFEQDAFAVDMVHPDGYSLGVEMGSELGNVTRHRSFFIIDRSVPVASEPGVNHNVDKAILYRRQID